MATDAAEVLNATETAPMADQSTDYDTASFYADDKPRDMPADAPTEEQAQDTPPVDAEPVEPIARPKSWGNDTDERWQQIPRETQEFISTREREREAMLTRRTQEAAQARQTVEREAHAAITQVQQSHAEQLEQMAQLIQLPSPPDPALLQSNDPEHHRLYMMQKNRYEAVTSQVGQLQRSAETARQQAQNLQSQARAQAIQADEARLVEKWPQWSEPSERAKLLAELQPIAAELGYGPEAQAEAGADDLFALDMIRGYRADALKYRELMKKRMEPVRAAKQMPPAGRVAPVSSARPPQDISSILYPNDQPRRN